MDQDLQIDDSLQQSLDQLDQQDQQHSQSSQQNNKHKDQEQENQQGNDKKKKKKRQGEEEDRKDYYAQMLPPDEDVQSTPPFVIVVQGSKSSGKTSVIRSLIKHYTKHKIDQITGTITLRSNKKQRITIIQCPNDLTAMIDLSKVADIVLLVIDASLSFQMETFQFLSLLKCHGFPNVMGVLTHLDYFKENKQLKKIKKKFKKRFEYEVGGNSKLFDMSKWQKGVYTKNDAAKLARYIGNSKPPAFPWRLNHPYIIADRWQTAQDGNFKPNDDINVAFYGYVRGGSYRVNGKMHIIGLGDYMINNIQVVNDPCPQYMKTQNDIEQHKQKTKGALEKEEQQSDEQQQKDNNNAMVAEISKKRKKKRTLTQSQRVIYAPSCNLGTLNFDYNSGYITIPQDYVKFTKIQGEDDQMEEGVKIVRNLQGLSQSINSKMRKREDQFELFDGVKMIGQQQKYTQTNEVLFAKKKMQIRQIREEAQALELINPHENNYERKQDLMHLIYESKEVMKTRDNSKFIPQGIYSQHLKSLFVTGMEQDVLKEMQEDSQDNQQQKQQKQINKIMKSNFTKAQITQQTNFYRKGYYIKIQISNIKYSSFLKMKSNIPIILTRLNLGQDNKSFIKVRFKRHRWYNNLLKSNDPIIVSSGWRRYQSISVYATEDPNERMRFLKYTPQHDFCYTIFYGNFNLQNSSCVFFQTIRNDLKKFRIAGSGLILQMNKSFQVMKKIKLVGQPYKIMKNTAFVKGMFNSSMQVASYIGAQIRTVSGIRGQIKKASKQGGQGTYRATFEDKISMSDLIFCRAWYKIVLQRYYSPILTFQIHYLMKTKYELRIQKGLDNQQLKDSEYKEIDRAPKVFLPFAVPKKLEAKLPFKTVQKVKQSRKQKIRRAQSQSIPKLLQSDKQKEVAALIQRLNTIKHMKQQKRQQKFKEKQRIRQAIERPRKQYYQKQKKLQKSQKMASLNRKNNKNKSHNKNQQEQ